jgi:hypothetical protein
MLTATLIALSTIALGPASTQVRPASGIVEIRAGMIDSASDVRRDQVRYQSNEPTEVVASMSGGVITWDQSNSERARLGGENAPELILVRAFDSVFAIDPFVRLPAGDITLMRQLFQGASLETDRSLFGQNRIERTEELMRILEQARISWLRTNGYYGVRTYTNPNAGKKQEGASLPEPAGIFRAPADAPRGRSREQVQADGRAAAIASAMLGGDEPVRISLPFGTAPDVVASVERRNQSEVASR